MELHAHTGDGRAAPCRCLAQEPGLDGHRHGVEDDHARPQHIGREEHVVGRMETDGCRVGEDVEGVSVEPVRRSAEGAPDGVGQGLAGGRGAVEHGHVGARAGKPVGDGAGAPAGADDGGAPALQGRDLFEGADGTDPVDVVAGEAALVVDHGVDRADDPRCLVDGVEVVDDPHLVGHGDAEATDAQRPHRSHGPGGVLSAEGDVHIVEAHGPVGGGVHGHAEAAGASGDRAAEHGRGGRHGGSDGEPMRDRRDDFSAGPVVQGARFLPAP